MSTVELPTALPVLQPLDPAAAPPAYLPATVETTLWGRLPAESDDPVLTVDPGTTVVIDTVSHEGILEDQGRDPVRFFGDHGIDPARVLEDAIAIAAHGSHDPQAGPHVVSGPIAVRGAQPGDLLAVHIGDLVPRAPYGVISSRHGKGLLPGRFPAGGRPMTSVFCPVEGVDPAFGTLPVRPGEVDRPIRFPLAPFLGLIGVATAGTDRVRSTPPGPYGGNLDITLLVGGTVLYLPVQVPGAGFYVGDPHFAQGNGEIALTALEAPLRASVTLDLIPAAKAAARFGGVRGPFAETPTLLVPTGLDTDLDLAVAACAENALELLAARFGIDPELGYAYLSAATDFDISQVVDEVKGVHARIRLADFAALARRLPGSGR
ncbi:acetamidase/formamidase family protein [Pseudonocardia kujensis]|uniref:acetamidase/formamidase family protein n=1 Tax=Pseudonocardia kujensis TaxID=1128675 RepID=UPI001E2DBF4C|nr:acetamidase/formamidase family protein [Pseudonocardia kujensis]MCE0764546.1 acetamidase/formamidase family protein [Pseudonocardia kujensis]